jgi:hypothetical protein
MKLTNRQAFWLFVWSMFGVFVGGPFVIVPVINRFDFVTNLALIVIGIIVACLAAGLAHRLEKRIRASRARLTRLIGTEDGQDFYAQLPEAIKMKIDKVIAAKD